MKTSSVNNYVQEGVVLSWKEVSVYAIDSKRKIRKRIVNSAKGIAVPGEMTVILGGSGSGKSSLMSAIAFRSLCKYY
uniref:ABC transporter domain-containing protein n=1 Tax=Trichogramma kaykai TaxID=54128 RepID=A0ABD2WKQ0_9HYME